MCKQLSSKTLARLFISTVRTPLTAHRCDVFLCIPCLLRLDFSSTSTAPRGAATVLAVRITSLNNKKIARSRLVPKVPPKTVDRPARRRRKEANVKNGRGDPLSLYLARVGGQKPMPPGSDVQLHLTLPSSSRKIFPMSPA